MSTVESKIVKVEVLDHPNADALEIARVGGEGGFECAVGLGQFKTGDLAIYVPVGSVVPDNILEHLSQNKVQMKTGRIRCAKIRGRFSEGLCLTPSMWLSDSDIKEDNDVTETLGIVKYEPPPPSSSGMLGVKYGINLHYENNNFLEYTCVENLKKYPDVLQEGEVVVATVKWHGTNFRCGSVRKPVYKKSLWEKTKEFFFGKDDFEFLVGSHGRVRYPSKASHETGEYWNDTYWRAAKKYNLQSIVGRISDRIAHATPDHKKPEVVLYAEIVGPGIQTGYDYGIEQSTIEIRVFDIMVNKKFLKWDVVSYWCNYFHLPMVEEVYRGPWSMAVTGHAKAVDEYNGKKYTREGVVIRPVQERWDPSCRRVIFKYLNEAYLLNKKNSEFH